MTVDARTSHGSNAIPGLDGLRALCILVVMLSHSGLPNLVPGVFGVTVFFFISGFLITTLLLHEHRTSGRIALGMFYTRRLLRLYPPLLAFVAVSALIWVSTGNRIDPLGLLGALAYLGNYIAIFDMGALQAFGGHLWSLAVEEHFYLFYPLLLIMLLRRPNAAGPVLFMLCMLSLGARIYVTLAHPDIAVDYAGMATECRIDGVLFGALTAVTLHGPEGKAFRERITRPAMIVIGLIVIVASLALRDAFFRSTLRYTVQELALAPLVVAATLSPRYLSIRRLLDSAPMVYIGKRSYALYLWHLSAIGICEIVLLGEGWRFAAAMLAAWVLSFLAAETSYRLVEAPCFALRRRFGSTVTSG